MERPTSTLFRVSIIEITNAYNHILDELKKESLNIFELGEIYETTINKLETVNEIIYIMRNTPSKLFLSDFDKEEYFLILDSCYDLIKSFDVKRCDIGVSDLLFSNFRRHTNLINQEFNAIIAYYKESFECCELSAWDFAMNTAENYELFSAFEFVQSFEEYTFSFIREYYRNFGVKYNKIDSILYTTNDTTKSKLKPIINDVHTLRKLFQFLVENRFIAEDSDFKVFDRIISLDGRVRTNDIIYWTDFPRKNAPSNRQSLVFIMLKLWVARAGVKFSFADILRLICKNFRGGNKIEPIIFTYDSLVKAREKHFDKTSKASFIDKFIYDLIN